MYNKSVEPARKRKYDSRLIWNAIFYLVKTGCQWWMLPLDFSRWQLVYYYYRKWASQLNFGHHSQYA
ncbi:transposase [Parabacteroides merdae]|uniref:transposase n=1 Tax=Parabacteroides TaxID=375288 RepID=UPI00374D2668